MRPSQLAFDVSHISAERLNGIGGVNDLPNRHRVVGDRNDVLPVSAPNLTDTRIEFVPLGPKGIKGRLSLGQRGCSIALKEASSGVSMMQFNMLPNSIMGVSSPALRTRSCYIEEQIQS